MFVISPFSRGGFVSSDLFDHTSLLRFLETRFGAEVPNLSAWRRATVGDMTTAFNFTKPDTSIPPLPPTVSAISTVISRVRSQPRRLHPIPASHPANHAHAGIRHPIPPQRHLLRLKFRGA